MTAFASTVDDSIEYYIALQHSLAYQYRKQAAPCLSPLRTLHPCPRAPLA